MLYAIKHCEYLFKIYNWQNFIQQSLHLFFMLFLDKYFLLFKP